MEKKRLVLKTQALILAVITFTFLISCSSIPQEVSENSAPAKSSITESAVVTPPLPLPSPPPSECVSKIPEEWNDNGIFSDYYEKSYILLEKMTLEEKIGQMLLIRCPQGDAAGIINKYKPGGIVFFEADFQGKTMDEVIGMTGSLQNASEIAMVMATDEEGGSVVRISRNINLSDQIFRSPQKIFANGGLEAVREDTLEKSALLKKLGLNLNLAPVADVSVSPADYIYARSFGQPAAETADYIATVISAMHEQNISAALKHFPGYGSNGDTHTGISVDNRPYSTFINSDFIPFEKGIAAGAECILISHNIVNCMDMNIPASLSLPVHKTLRNTLKFTGIIMTDDLSMEAIKDYTGNTHPAVEAVFAGNDMILMKDYESAFTSILNAVNSGELSARLIDHAVFRVLAWKMASGII